MSWITMIFAAPVSLFRSLILREPTVTWEMLERNRCEGVQLTAMLNSTREAIDGTYDVYVHAMLQGQLEDLQWRQDANAIEGSKLRALAYKQGLMIDRVSGNAC